MHGLEELIEALARSERRALRSHLIRLMQHIVKWRVQPERRLWSWVATIRNARRDMIDIQRETPSLNLPSTTVRGIPGATLRWRSWVVLTPAMSVFTAAFTSRS